MVAYEIQLTWNTRIEHNSQVLEVKNPAHFHIRETVDNELLNMSFESKEDRVISTSFLKKKHVLIVKFRMKNYTISVIVKLLLQ